MLPLRHKAQLLNIRASSKLVAQLWPDFVYHRERIFVESKKSSQKQDHSKYMTTEQSEQQYKNLPSSDPANLRRINKRNRQFWSKQSKLTVRRISDPTLYALATRDMHSEAIRVALREQKSLDQALADADQSQNILLESLPQTEERWRGILARKGGRAPKTDALQALIQNCVRKLPNISQQELRHQLKKHLGLGTIMAIDNQGIQFVARKGMLKTAPISGLKDRLSRAKLKIYSL